MLLPLLSGNSRAQAYGQSAASMLNTPYQTSPPAFAIRNETIPTFNPETTIASPAKGSTLNAAAIGFAPNPSGPLSGDHTEIKQAVGAQADDDVRISPSDEVWVQKPDRS